MSLELVKKLYSSNCIDDRLLAAELFVNLTYEEKLLLCNRLDYLYSDYAKPVDNFDISNRKIVIQNNRTFFMSFGTFFWVDDYPESNFFDSPSWSKAEIVKL